MLRIRIPVLILAVIVAAGLTPLSASGDDPPLHPYQQLEGRREGVLPRPEIEPGRKISLVALRIDAHPEPPTDPADPFRISFWQPDSGAVQVLVRETTSLYKMEMRRDLGAGVSRLEWPADIPVTYGLTATDLAPLVVVETPARREYSPAIVSRGSSSADGVRYVFTVLSRVPVTLLDWEIRKAGEEIAATSSTERGIAAYSPFEIVWTPRTEGEEQDPEGEYDFTIRTTLQPQPGTPARKETRRFRFRHLPETVAAILADD
jgi:hypothetical protein